MTLPIKATGEAGSEQRKGAVGAQDANDSGAQIPTIATIRTIWTRMFG
jgi:hypothetical protein